MARHWAATVLGVSGLGELHCMQLTCTLTTTRPATAPGEAPSSPPAAPIQPRSGVPVQARHGVGGFLGTVHATPTRVEPAVPALPDEPERTAVADVARPLDQGVVRLDHDKRVRAVAVASERHLLLVVSLSSC
jgi:hypothetical protein